MRRIELLFAAFSIVLGAAAGCKSPSAVFEEREMLKQYVMNSQRYYNARDYERAVHQAKKALDIDSKHSKALLLLGYCYLQVARVAETREERLEYYEKTEDAFDKAILSGSETDPAIFKAYFGEGLDYFMWAQEIKDMIYESHGEDEPTKVTGTDAGLVTDLWSK